MLCRTMQPEYRPAGCLSVVKCASNRRLISRFRAGCHGLRADTGRWADGVHLDRTDFFLSDRSCIAESVSALHLTLAGACIGSRALSAPANRV